MAVANPLLDGKADQEKRDDLEEADAGINRVAHERARRRPTGVAGVEARARHAINLRRFAEDQRESRREDHGRAGKVAEDVFRLPPARIREENAGNARRRRHQRNPRPVQSRHTKAAPKWPPEQGRRRRTSTPSYRVSRRLRLEAPRQSATPRRSLREWRRRPSRLSRALRCSTGTASCTRP